MKRIAGLLLVVLAVAGALWADSVLSITGAGATFPYPMYSKWFDEYHKKNANLQINYQSIGSDVCSSDLSRWIDNWFDEYHKKNANLQINYQSIGSDRKSTRLNANLQINYQSIG